MYACICRGITEQAVRDMAGHNCFTFAHYASLLKGEKCCYQCLPRIKELIYEEKQSRKEAAQYYEAASSAGEFT